MVTSAAIPLSTSVLWMQIIRKKEKKKQARGHFYEDIYAEHTLLLVRLRTVCLPAAKCVTFTSHCTLYYNFRSELTNNKDKFFNQNIRSVQMLNLCTHTHKDLRTCTIKLFPLNCSSWPLKAVFSAALITCINHKVTTDSEKKKHFFCPANGSKPKISSL